MFVCLFVLILDLDTAQNMVGCVGVGAPNLGGGTMAHYCMDGWMDAHFGPWANPF